MRWLQSEYILKGVYLGLLLYVALQQREWQDTAWVAAFAFGGLALALAVAGRRKVKEGVHVRGRLLSFTLFLLLENPFLVYLGILGGMLAAAVWFGRRDESEWLLPALAGGGAVLGLGFWAVRHVQDRRIRLGASLLLAVLLGGAAVFWFQDFFATGHQRSLFGTLLLLGIPLFYLLTLAGMAEESEIEIGAMCAALFLGLWTVGRQVTEQYYLAIAVTVPLLLYFLYTRYILSSLRVLKHAIRGISYARLGQYRWALLALRRALQLDPRNPLARETLWGVHRQMDYNQVARDPETLALVDFDLCLERAGSLLLRAGPKPEHLKEAHRLLDMIAGQRPAMVPACQYWRAVALTHERKYEQAAAALESVLVPTPEGAANPYRREILMSAWQLALTLHPELHKRVGVAQLGLPGRRMEAIAAVERYLARSPGDPDAWNLKRLLYQDLTEAEYDEAAGPGQAAADFNHEYAQELGLALINDPARWKRGAEYLRIAARGQPTLAPALFYQIAKAHERAGDAEGVWQHYGRVKEAGRLVGPKNLSPEDHQLYFAVVKVLGEDAVTRGDLDAAIDAYLLYREYDRSGKETYRTLTNLYEQKKDAWAALHATEQGLLYDSQDKDFLAKKDKYYFSVTPEELRQRWESVHRYFDLAYCLQKAQWALKHGEANLDLLDWADHLANLVQAVQPDNLSAKVVRARALLLRGEREQAQALLEDVRTNKPEKFRSGDDEDAWFTSAKLLGSMYLHELHQPERAVECFLDFRKSPRSGADTLFRLGQAYEELGDRVRAVKCYKQVVSFDSHPLAPDAHDALNRLQSPAP
jgi:tetratricopeptide (TPR) repeat protein